MVWRVSDRASFEALRRRSRRARSGPVSVAYNFSDDPPVARVAYAVGRSVGGAVVRNRVRRRLREAVADVADRLPAGTYLVSVDPEAAELAYEELRTAVAVAMTTVSAGKQQSTQ